MKKHNGKSLVSVASMPLPQPSHYGYTHKAENLPFTDGFMIVEAEFTASYEESKMLEMLDRPFPVEGDDVPAPVPAQPVPLPEPEKVMNRANIEHTIALLKNVKTQNKPFDMSEWFAVADDPHDCNTAACMAGWMARDDYFKKQGLTIDDNCVELADKGRGETAIASLFDIDYITAGYLIFPGEYPTKWEQVSIDHVITRLQELLEFGEEKALAKWRTELDEFNSWLA